MHSAILKRPSHASEMHRIEPQTSTWKRKVQRAKKGAAANAASADDDNDSVRPASDPPSLTRTFGKGADPFRIWIVVWLWIFV